MQHDVRSFVFCLCTEGYATEAYKNSQKSIVFAYLSSFFFILQWYNGEDTLENDEEYINYEDVGYYTYTKYVNDLELGGEEVWNYLLVSQN